MLLCFLKGPIRRFSLRLRRVVQFVALLRSLNVSEERISLVDIRYDGKKWLAGPNGRRLEMVARGPRRGRQTDRPPSARSYLLARASL